MGSTVPMSARNQSCGVDNGGFNMQRLTTTTFERCAEDVECCRPAEFLRTKNPPNDTKTVNAVCRYHAFRILRECPDQMAELLLDLVP
jgi:hypothetical protein